MARIMSAVVSVATVLAFLTLTLSLDPVRGQKKTLHVVGFLPMSGGWPGGGACLVANNLALERVNEAGILDDYRLEMTWRDTQCNAGVAVVKMFELLYEDPVKVMLMGPGCSTEAEAMAQVCHLWNLTMISYGSSSPVLSDRKRFPTFFRLASPDQTHNPARLMLMEIFKWKRVATINQARDFFSMIIDDFVRSVQGREDITIISQEIFQNDPTTRVENLKKQDARIIFTACYEDRARHMLCAARRIGMYGPKIVWVFVGWYGEDWWKVPDVSCTLTEMEEVAEGAIITGSFYRNPIPGRGIANITVDEFDHLLTTDPTFRPEYMPYMATAASCFDVFWAIGLALNCTATTLREIGHPKTLDQFTYKDSDINDIITRCQSQVRFKGIAGNVKFGDGADPIKNARIARIQDGVLERVGTYRVDVEPTRIDWIDSGIKWKDGLPPRDATLIMEEEVVIPAYLYFTFSALAAAGISLAIVLLLFNIFYRNNRIVKLSSPNINNILLFGCLLTYLTIFMERPTTPEDVVPLCKAKQYCFILGFTLSFGALFSKTWRVYRIFTNKKLLKMTIKDYQLLWIIGGLLGIVVCVIIVREIVDPQTLLKHELTKDVYDSGNDAEVHPYNFICHSEHSAYFAWTVYIIEGALIAFGAFLAWETRHVKIEALNDSHQIGMCLYNVVVLSAVGLTLSLVLSEQLTLMYGINSGCIIVGTTVTQVVVFVPKVAALRQNQTTVEPFGTGMRSVTGTGLRSMTGTGLGTSNSGPSTATNLTARPANPGNH